MKIETDLKFILDMFSEIFFSYKRYQTGISKQKIKPETIDFTMISGFRGLFKFYRRRRLTCTVIQYAVDAFDFIHDPIRYLI